MRRWWVLSGGLALAVVGIGLYLLMYSSGTCLVCSVTRLPTTQSDASVVSHLAPGLLPPTNRWFSGMVFGEGQRPVYPLPLSFRPTNTGFELHQPQITATADTVIAPHVPTIAVRIPEVTHYLVTAYDELTVTVTFYDQRNKPVVKTLIAQGSPYVFVTALRQTVLTATTMTTWDQATTRVTDAYYGVRASATAPHGRELSVDMAKGHSASVYGAPSAVALKTLAHHATTVVTGSTVDFSLGATISTRVRLKTAAHAPTVFAAMPHQSIRDGQAAGYTYQTIYGSLQTYVGTAFEYELPQTMPSGQLDVSALSSAQRTEVTTQLARDINYMQLAKDDTYFGGKELYRAANLMRLAYQLDRDDLGRVAQDKLRAQLGLWLTPRSVKFRTDRYFSYDTTLRGVVGTKASFGSEEFNDHHFHYGYFIYAAAILAQHDTAFVREHGMAITALVMDIAAPEVNDAVPQRRVFDIYAGHSWASGLTPFADGNNQESSSEAMNAWNGVALWGDVIREKSVSDNGRWMLAHEAATAQAYWLQSGAIPGYAHQTVGINWGDKRDFATFFSASPNAIVGIQLIPMNPSMTAMDARLAEKIMQTPGLDNSQQFTDYLLMYRSLYDKAGAITQMKQLPDTGIDDGNSRSYMMAWIYSR